MYREHWINVIRYCRKYVWLLIFPLIRGIKSIRTLKISVAALNAWVKGSSFDILVMLLIICYGFLKWYYSKYDFDESGISHEYGIIMKKKTYIPTSSIVSVIAEKTFYLIPFKAVKFYVDTSSGNISESDIHLLIKLSDYEKMKETMPIFKRTKNAPPEKKPSVISILLFSMFFSSSLSGTVYVIAFLIQGGKNVIKAADEFRLQERFTEISTNVSSKLQVVPPIIITIVSVIAFLWFVSFVANCFRYANFRIVKRNKNIKINYGLISKRDYFIDSSKINYTDLRQNLIMKVKAFDIMSITASCPGYGNKSTQIPVFIPVLSRKTVRETLNLLMPDKIILSNKYRSRLRSFWQFVWQPVIAGVALLVLCLVAAYFFEILRSFILFLLLMIEIPIIWLFFIRVADIFSNGIGIKNNQIVLRYCKGFDFHTVLADCNKIVRVKIVQSYFQKRKGICHMFFYFESRNSKKHKILAIPIESAREVEKLING